MLTRLYKVDGNANIYYFMKTCNSFQDISVFLLLCPSKLQALDFLLYAHKTTHGPVGYSYNLYKYRNYDYKLELYCYYYFSSMHDGKNYIKTVGWVGMYLHLVKHNRLGHLMTSSKAMKKVEEIDKY